MPCRAGGIGWTSHRTAAPLTAQRSLEALGGQRTLVREILSARPSERSKASVGAAATAFSRTLSSRHYEAQPSGNTNGFIGKLRAHRLRFPIRAGASREQAEPAYCRELRGSHAAGCPPRRCTCRASAHRAGRRALPSTQIASSVAGPPTGGVVIATEVPDFTPLPSTWPAMNRPSNCHADSGAELPRPAAVP
jgi:hypothetical protein